MNNEPVAWMRTNKQWRKEVSWVEKEGFEIPLYTHPAKTEDNGKVCARCGAIAYDPVITQTAKTLTDEEIKQIFKEQTGFYFDDNPADDLALMDFARAILRKAQEK